MLSTLRRRLEAHFGDQSDEGSDAERESTDRSERDTGTLLHTCPDCEEVYLSEGARTCSTCDRQTVPAQGD